MTLLRSVLILALLTSLVGIAGCGGSTQEQDAGSRDASAASDSGDGSIDRDATGALDADDGEAPDASARSDGGGGPGTGLVTVAEGGLVVSEDGLFEIYVFPGALTDDTTITITRVADGEVPADVLAESPLSAVYDVRPDGLTFGGDGAWGHFSFAAVPAGLVTSDGTTTTYATLTLRARPAAGGAITEHLDPLAYYADDGSLHALARLEHLSMQWTTARDGLGVHQLGVEWPASSHEVGDVFSAAARISSSYAFFEPSSFSVHVGEGDTAIRAFGPAARPVPGFIPNDEVLAAFALVRDPGLSFDAPIPTPGAGQALTPTPTWRCDAEGESRIAVAATFYRGPPSAFVRHLAVREPSRCTAPTAARASVIETLGCTREGELSVCTSPPTPVAEVTSSAPSRTYVAVRDSFAVVEPRAPTVGLGPATITATSGASTMTATRDATTGIYVSDFSDPDLFAFDTDITWNADGSIAVATSVGAGYYGLGPILGLDTSIAIDAAAPDDAIVRMEWIPDEPFPCGFDDVSAVIQDVRVAWFRAGTTGDEGRIGVLLEDAATFCGVTTSEISAIPARIRLSNHGRLETLDGPSGPVRVDAARALELSVADLMATCSGGRTYCTDACVDTATDPLNCGGCGLTPLELCDTVDNDCDGMIDEGCPRIFGWPASLTTTGPIIGGSSVGDSGASSTCPTSQFLTGLCVNVDDATGNIRSMRPFCGYVTMTRPTAASPDDYRIDITPTGCASTGGGSSGGTAQMVNCPAGMLVDGLSGVEEPYVGRLGLRCSSIDVQRRGDGTWGVVRTGSASTTTVGTGPGMPFPDWTIADHATTRHPGAVRGFELRYQVPGVITYFTIYGGWPTLTY